MTLQECSKQCEADICGKLYISKILAFILEVKINGMDRSTLLFSVVLNR
jgi:hypothetical protein